MMNLGRPALFQIAIRQAEPGSKLLPGTGAIVTLVGDAMVSAHYRLGVGVNNAFVALPEVSTLVDAMVSHHHRKQLEPSASEMVDLHRELEHGTTIPAAYCEFRLKWPVFQYCFPLKSRPFQLKFAVTHGKHRS